MGYEIAENLKHALDLLRGNKSKAQVIAGATDLFLQGLPEQVVDLSGVPELTCMEAKDGHLYLGSSITHAEAAHSPLINEEASALAEACLSVGSPQVRNAGTIGGNIINAAPAADAAVALVGLGAEAVLVGTDGRSRRMAVEKLYSDYNCSTIDSSSEIMTTLVVKLNREEEGSAFSRFSPRRALSLPLLNTAVRLHLIGGRIEEIRLVVAPAQPAPTRLIKTEEKLLGFIPGKDSWDEVAKIASDEADVRGSLLRCSEQYRRHLVGVLTVDALQKAVNRARNAEGSS